MVQVGVDDPAVACVGRLPPARPVGQPGAPLGFCQRAWKLTGPQRWPCWSSIAAVQPRRRPMPAGARGPSAKSLFGT